MLPCSKIPCPYGQIGDQLWIRESFYQFGNWEKIPDRKTKTGKQKWKFVPADPRLVYEENAPKEYRKGRHHKDPYTTAWHKRLARFMPRTASRLTLEIKTLRVERLQDISRGDAMAEGCPFSNMAKGPDPRKWYSDLWESINGAQSWKDNPWVWVLEFQLLTSNS